MTFQKFPMCLYKPGPLKLAGLELSATTVHDEDGLSAALAEGWKADPLECVKPTPAPEPRPMPTPAPAPISRAELEAKAKALGVPFNARTSDETLAERIAAKG